MMVNRHRGEVPATFDGRDYTLCLTLGALAELEDAYAADDLGALTDRFSTGRLRAGDMLRILGAGLRGAGYTISNDELAEMQVEGGALGYAKLVADLLTATFGSPDETP